MADTILEAPPSKVNIVDAGPPKPPPAPTRTIRVSEMSSPGGAPAIDKGPAYELAPKPGMSRLQTDLRKKAGVAEETPPVTKPPTKPAEAPPTETVEEPAAPPSEVPPPATETKPAATKPGEKPGKPNPWKLVEEYKTKATTLEKELLDVRSRVTPETDRKAFQEQVTRFEARVKELEDEIRYVNFEKHPDFIKDFQKPYERAWEVATKELSEIAITDPQTRQVRAATADDLTALVYMPLGQAREAANQVFGYFADDIMSHRKEIRALLEKKQNALKDAKENGGAREKAQRESHERAMGELNKSITTTWEKVNAAALEDPKYGSYFKPKEGDQEWNQRLSKGFQMTDQAFSENPSDPRLTPEQRASAIKRHAAVRNRAASWGAVRFWGEQGWARVAELEKELAEFKSTTPPADGGLPGSGEAAPTGSAMDRMKAELRKRAK